MGRAFAERCILLALGFAVGAGTLGALWNGSHLLASSVKRGAVYEIPTGDQKGFRVTEYSGKLFLMIELPAQPEPLVRGVRQSNAPTERQGPLK